MRAAQVEPPRPSDRLDPDMSRWEWLRRRYLDDALDSLAEAVADQEMRLRAIEKRLGQASEGATGG